jgi:hypothetical protein
MEPIIRTARLRLSLVRLSVMRVCIVRLSVVIVALLAWLVSGTCCTAQRRVVATLPDAPKPQQAKEVEGKAKGWRSRTTYEILARRSFFFPDLAYTNKPLTSAQKFLLAADESVAPSGLIVATMSAAISQARNSWPGYGQGWNGYGKRYGATLALNASTDMFGTFLLPSMLHHDPRYFVLARGTVSQKIGHALKRVVVTRTDAGGDAMNVSGVLGPLAAEGLANTYLPDAERTAGRTFERFGIQLAVIAGSNVVKEFWPAIFKTLRIAKFAPGANAGAHPDASPKP